MDSSKPTSGKVAKENAQSIKVLDDLMAKLNLSKSQDETNAATQSLATFINGDIESQTAPTKYVSLPAANTLHLAQICACEDEKSLFHRFTRFAFQMKQI